MWTCCVTSIYDQAFPYCDRCQSAFRWGFSVESFLKGSHTVRPVWCVSTCVHLCAFYLFTCGGCDVEPTIRKRPACLKSLSVLSVVFLFCFHSSFLLPLFPPLRFTRPSHTSSKGLPDTPLSDALSPTALQSPHSVHVCVWKETFEQKPSWSHTFYPLCLLRAKKVEEEKQKERRVGLGGGVGGADWVIAAH